MKVMCVLGLCCCLAVSCRGPAGEKGQPGPSPDPSAVASAILGSPALLAELEQLIGDRPKDLPFSRPMKSLSVAEKGAVCSWEISTIGSPGSIISCLYPDGKRHDRIVGSIGQCVDRTDLSKCSMTVGEWVACSKAQQAASCDGRANCPGCDLDDMGSTDLR
jgi:hypothetical protein